MIKEHQPIQPLAAKH